MISMAFCIIVPWKSKGRSIFDHKYVVKRMIINMS